MTDTATDAFTDITPVAHWQCRLCYPAGTAKPRAVCGVLLLGLDPLPDSDRCDDCDREWPEHIAGHWGPAMNDRTALGDRMKRYEAAHRAVLPRRRTPPPPGRRTLLPHLPPRRPAALRRTVLRRHGRRPSPQPSAPRSVAACSPTRSPSVLATDFATIQTQPWFEGVVAKLVSVSPRSRPWCSTNDAPYTYWSGPLIRCVRPSRVEARPTCEPCPR